MKHNEFIIGEMFKSHGLVLTCLADSRLIARSCPKKKLLIIARLHHMLKDLDSRIAQIIPA